MSSKLTSEKLKELVREILQEGRVKLNVPFKDFKSNSKTKGNFNVSTGGAREKVGLKVGTNDLKNANKKFNFNLQDISKDNLKTLLLSLPEKSYKYKNVNDNTKSFYKPAKADPPPAADPVAKADPADPVAKADTTKKADPADPVKKADPPGPVEPTPAQQTALDAAIASIKGAKNLPLDAAQTTALQNIKDAKASTKINWSKSTKQIDDAINHHSGLKPAPIKPTSEPLELGIKVVNKKLSNTLGKEYDALITTLQTALTNKGITAAELKFLAGLDADTTLSEDADKLEIADIEKLFSIGAQDPANLDKKPKGSTQDIFDIGKKIDAVLDTYVDKAIELGFGRDKIRALINVKNDFPKMLARDKSYNPADESGVKGFEIPRSGQLDAPETAGRKKASINPKLVQCFSNFFAQYGATNLVSRMQAISKFSEDFVKKRDIDLEKFANGAPILKIMSNITRQFNASSGGTEMEATLALLIGGEKIGGSNGAGDFVGDDGQQYSAKWVLASSGIKQASFKEALSAVPNKRLEMTYVLGIKSDAGGAPVADISKNMLKTEAVKVYLLKFIYEPNAEMQYYKDGRIPYYSSREFKYLDDEEKTKELEQLDLTSTEDYIVTKDTQIGTIKAYKMDENKKLKGQIGPDDGLTFKFGDLKKGKDSRNFDNKTLPETWISYAVGLDGNSQAASIIAMLGDPVGTISFVNGNTKTFSDQFNDYVEAKKDTAIQYMSNINKKLNRISDATMDFATDKTLNSAYSMSDNYNSVKEDIINLFDTITKKSGGPKNIASKVGLTENKTKSLKDLDKLIERVILENMNKK